MDTAELVRLAKLDATLSPDLQYTRHPHFFAGTGHRRTEKEAIWKRALKPLGTGGQGEVYREECVGGGDVGALRAVKSIQKPTSPQARKINYANELRTVARFSQPSYERSFVKSFGWYENVDTVFIAMEYISLGDLHRHVGTRFPEGEVQTIVSQVLDGLKLMHAAGYAHRDLKPPNLLVVEAGPQWHVKIADFGLSKWALTDVTSLRTQAGTFGFMAPEVLGLGSGNEDSSDEEDEPSYTYAVDIFALGVIAYLLLTARMPFSPLEPRALGRYARGKTAFPMQSLVDCGVTSQGRELIKRSMAPGARSRPTAGDARRDEWLVKSQSVGSAISLSQSESVAGSDQASARWTTVDIASQDYREVHQPTETDTVWRPSVIRSTGQLQAPHDVKVCQLNGASSLKKDVTSISVDEVLSLQSSGTVTESIGTASSTAPTVSLPYRPEQPKSNQDSSSRQGSPQSSSSVSRSKSSLARATDRTMASWQPARGLRWDSSAVLKSHSEPVASVAFCPDGCRVVSGSQDMTIKIWDVAEGYLHETLRRHSSGVTSLAVSSNWTLLSAAHSSAEVFSWDLATGHELPAQDVAMGKYPLSVKYDWSTLEGERMPRSLKVLYSDYVVDDWRAGPSHVAFSPGHNFWASGLSSEGIELYTWPSNLFMRRLGHGTSAQSDLSATCVALSPDGKTLVSGDSHGVAHLWNVFTGSVTRVLQAPKPDDPANAVTSLVFAGTAGILAIGTRGGTIWLWDLTHNTTKTLAGHDGAVSAMVFSPDGLILASASKDKTVRLWRWLTVAELSAKESLRLSQNRQGSNIEADFDALGLPPQEEESLRQVRIASGRDLYYELTGWESSAMPSRPAQQGALQEQRGQHQEEHVYSTKARLFGFEPDPTTVTTTRLPSYVERGFGDLKLLKQNLDGRMRLVMTRDNTNEVIMSQIVGPKMQLRPLAIGKQRKSDCWWVWDASYDSFDSGPVFRSIGACFKDSKSAAMFKEAIVEAGLWNEAIPMVPSQSSQERQDADQLRLELQTARTDFGTFSLAASGLSDVPETIQKANNLGSAEAIIMQEAALKTLQPRGFRLAYPDQKRVSSVAFSSDGKCVSSSCMDGTAKVWNVASGKRLKTLMHERSVCRVALSPDGSLLASALEPYVDEYVVVISNVARGSEVRRFTVRGDAACSSSLIFSSDGQLLAFGVADKTLFFDVATWKLTMQLASSSRDGRMCWTIVSASDIIVLSDEMAETILKRLEAQKVDNALLGVQCMDFSPDGRRLATVERHRQGLAIWMMPEHTVHMVLQTAESDPPIRVAFSPMGRFVATGSRKGTVAIWDITYDSAVLVRTLAAHAKCNITSLAYSPDGCLIAFGRNDSKVTLWNWNA